MICLEGEIKIVINAQQYDMKQRDIIVAFPNSIAQKISCSDNFKGVLLGIETEFGLNTPIKNKNIYFIEIANNPCISLTEIEINKILSLYDMLLSEEENHTFKNEINESLYKLIIYEVASTYNNRMPLTSQKRTSDERIFDQFIYKLYNDYKEHRRLNYYASLQQITPTHLSKATKRVSGLTAAEWIVKCVISNIKIKLDTEEYIPIYKIAEEFNFPNDSFFSQYFKKYTGKTPKEYRNEIKS